MKVEELLQQSLEIEAPWQVVDVRRDLGRKQIDVWVGLQSGKSSWLFGAKTATVREDQTHVWRHLNLCGSRCLVHAEATPESATQPWRGEAGQPFTHLLSRSIVSMIRDGIKLQSICSILDIPVGDLWKFKHALDSGKTGISSLPPEAKHSADADSGVPEPDSRVWMALLEGRVNIDIRLLSLKLLLTKMREQMRVIADNEVRTLKCYELQRFFVRYEKTLGHELAQLEKLA
ncbi:hypothetical protein [Propionivibrio soli]|uniref:hypothetical protein n=1 Tax=Propionivibrio soli TaxID=2976531 RepID=UPI0021E6F49C|nr:hypothetical protein [Propionivibrio soli]